MYEENDIYNDGGGSPSPSNFVIIDGVIYPFVKIGNQLWITENLRMERGNWVKPGDTVLYDGTPETIASIESFLVDGWVIPSRSDFQTLYDYVNLNRSGTKGVGYYLKSVSYGGNDEFGFNGYNTGSDVGGNFLYNDTDYWTSTELSVNSRVRWELREGSNAFTNSIRTETGEYFGIRLVKNI